MHLCIFKKEGMKIEMYKVVTIDLDGTLLNSFGEISTENIEELKRCIDNNVEVVLASGRVVSSIRNFANEIGNNNYLIAGNGSIVYDIRKEQVIYQNTIPKEKVLDIIKICEENSIYYSVYTDSFIVTKSLNYNILFYSKENLKKSNMEKTNINITQDIYSYINDLEENKVSKISICDKDKMIFSSILRRLRDIEGIDVLDVAHMSRKYIENGTEIVPVEFYYTEITNQNVNKWEAIKFLIDELQILPNEVLSIGDNINDKEMLENAGMGVAMGNSAPYIKELAKDVTLDNNENGVAEALKRYVNVV